MCKAYRLFKQMLVAVIALAMLTSAWPSAAQGEKPVRDVQRISDLKTRIHLGDLPPVMDRDTRCNALPSHPSSITGEMDWTIIVYQTSCNGYGDIFAVDRNSVQYNRWLTNDQDPDIEPNLNYSANRVVFSRLVKIRPQVFWWQIFTINVDRSSLTQLTFDSHDHRGPVWSPDDSRIAFAYKMGLNWNIYVMNANGTNIVPLTNDLTDNTQPTWSSDGSKIAWIKGGTTGAIWIMNADGSNQHPIATNLVYAENLRWSPDNMQLALDYDSDGDVMNELAIINADGTALHTVFDLNTPMEEMWLSGWSPDGQALIFTRVVYTSSGIAYPDVRRVPVTGTFWSFFDYVSCVNSLHVDWKPLERGLPVSHVEALPTWSPAAFAVIWSGYDVGPSDIASFDVQVKDGATGSWTNWQVGTTSLDATYTGSVGHTYYFRSRAHDNAFNVEAYPSTPDAMTTIYQYAASGQVRDNRDQPIAVVNVQANPTALNTGISRHDGIYDLYFASGGVYALTTMRSNFGILPPLLNVIVPTSNSLLTLYLPPLDDQIVDGHFESGNLSAWNAAGDITPTITTAAHTGNYAALLGGTVPSGTLTTAPYHSTIEQTIALSPTIVSGTLSLLYQVVSADPLSDTLNAYLIGPTDTLTFTLPLTASGWSHAWWDVSSWSAPTATVRIELTHGSNLGSTNAVFDDISWGSSNKGGEIVYLPVMYR